MDVVTEIVSVRARRPTASSACSARRRSAHVALVALVVLGPASWFGARTRQGRRERDDDQPRRRARPARRRLDADGRPAGAGSVTEAKPVVEPVRPPAARTPEMIEPTKTAPKKAETKVRETTRRIRGAARRPRARKCRKAAPSPKPAARGQGFGLSPGGGGTGSYLDTANFCCPEYIGHDARSDPPELGSQAAGASGTTLVKFTIQRDGTLTAVQVEKSSGYPALDYMASRALFLTQQAAAAARGVHRTVADGSSRLRVSTLMTSRISLVISCRSSRRSASCWRSSRHPSRRRISRRSSPPSIETTLTGDPGTPPRLAVPDFLRAVERSRDAGDRAHDRRGAVERPRLRARVLHDSARHLQVDSGRRRRSASRRSIAGASSAPTAWCVGTVSKTGNDGAGRDAAVPRGGAPADLRARNTAGRRPTRGSTRTRSPTRFTSRSGRCAASRARS